MTVLTREQARRIYDRIGAKQDTQAFYEDRATGFLVEHGRFERAARVLEFGCGTGRFARGLLSDHLPPTATYRGLDLSPTMVRIATERLAAFAPRAEVILTDGAAPGGEPAASCDRFVSNYVLDLLAEDDIADVLREAHRILVPGGLLCVASLSVGKGFFSRRVSRAWTRLHARHPAWVGGCRPIDLGTWLAPGAWRVLHHAELAPFGVPSAAWVAERRA